MSEMRIFLGQPNKFTRAAFHAIFFKKMLKVEKFIAIFTINLLLRSVVVASNGLKSDNTNKGSTANEVKFHIFEYMHVRMDKLSR